MTPAMNIEAFFKGDEFGAVNYPEFTHATGVVLNVLRAGTTVIEPAPARSRAGVHAQLPCGLPAMRSTAAQQAYWEGLTAELEMFGNASPIASNRSNKRTS